MQRTTFVGLAAALGVAGTVFLTVPSWASDSHHGCHHSGWWWSCFDDHRWYGPHDGHYYGGDDYGDDHVAVWCPDGYRTVRPKKDSDDDASVRREDYHGHHDCWIASE